jgi:hypothetical protein
MRCARIHQPARLNALGNSGRSVPPEFLCLAASVANESALDTGYPMPTFEPCGAECPTGRGIAFDRQQQRASRRVGRASVLVPIAQCRDRQILTTPPLDPRSATEETTEYREYQLTRPLGPVR